MQSIARALLILSLAGCAAPIRINDPAVAGIQAGYCMASASLGCAAEFADNLLPEQRAEIEVLRKVLLRSLELFQAKIEEIRKSRESQEEPK